MQTFDESLYRLYASGSIGLAEALDNADSRTDLSLRVRLSQPTIEVPGLGIEEMS
jgi:twitching motility protein PilU